MKSREEYQASIFAKRDALLAKRRRRISQTAAFLSIVICFAIAFAVLPKKLSKKLSSEETVQLITDDTITADAPTAETSTVQAYTFHSSYIRTEGTRKHTQKAAAAANPTVEELAQVITQIHLPNQETEIAQESEETTRKALFGGGFRPEMWDDETIYEAEGDITPADSPDYTTEEIIAEARKYLESGSSENTDSEDSYETKTDVTVTKTSSGSYYTVYFYFPSTTTKVKLDGDTLELIEYSDEWSENGKTMTTPAYIPTTAKPAMTTAAPEYRPQ